jgi:acid phosphatase (class A)
MAAARRLRPALPPFYFAATNGFGGNMSRIILVPIIFSFALLAGGTVANAEMQAAPSTSQFLSATELDLGLSLPQPAAEGSTEQMQELAELHRLEDSRTPSDWKRAQWDDSHESGEIFADVLGPNFDLSKLTATAKLLADVRQEEKIAAKRAKDHFKRKRPWVLDPSLKTCSREDGPLTSYPSGHTVMGYSMAEVLVAAIPAKSQAIMARAQEYAYNRLVCAMHFESDIEAGKTLGIEIGDALLKNPKFQSELQAASSELQQFNQ